MSKLASGNPLGTSISSSELTADAITGQTASVAADDADSILIYDNSASALRKQTRSVFTTGLGASFTPLTAGTLTVSNSGANGKPFVATWNDTNVNALGAVNAGDIKVCTLPASTWLRNMNIVITSPESVTTTLTVAGGVTGPNYIDLIVASDAKAAANTIYGNDSGERGTNLTGYFRPSYNGTTDVYIRFVSTGDTLDNSLDNGGRVEIEYTIP